MSSIRGLVTDILDWTERMWFKTLDKAIELTKEILNS